jgi:ABC-type transport system involved in cytochrome c biogenesis permease subunit
MIAWSRFVPWIVLFLFGAFVGVVAAPPSDTAKMQLYEFGKIPVQESGRIKPVDTLARTTLMVISNRQTFKDTKDTEQPAIKWLLDVMVSNLQSREDAAINYKVFRIENIQVLDLLGLKQRPGSWRYSISEMAGKFKEFDTAVRQALDVNEKKRDLYETKLLELRKHIDEYMKLMERLEPHIVPPSTADGTWQSLSEIDERARVLALGRMKAEAEKKKIDLLKQPQDQLLGQFHDELQKARQEISPEAQSLVEILDYYQTGKADQFNQAVADYLARVGENPACDMTRTSLEAFFNHFEPFYWSTVFYVMVFFLAVVGLLLSVGWNAGAQPLCQAAFWLAAFTMVLHTFALCTRMYLQGRPPVTNLYSAAVWISWGCVGLGLTLERIYANGIGNIVAAVPGFLSMFLAHHLAGSGDTLQMMQAVLDTNFWLATHVTVVTFGYVATVVAGFIGVLYVLLGVLTPALNRDMAKVLAQMTYGVLCFATLLSFTGTVLGGIWADQSWGRFWGWDPKENGALIIVLWNALTLHARWAGIIKQRGMAVLSIVGIMVTGWSFIGTNQLGVGLHAYGFNNTLAMVLVVTWGICLALIVLGMLPMRWWLSRTTLTGLK